MSAERHGGSRWPSRWTATPATGRVPVPSAEVVAAAPLRAALTTALDGRRPPCHGHAQAWTSSDAVDVLVAQEGCADCPATRQCAAYADGIDATAGTWGGTDRTPRADRRRRQPTDDTGEMEQAS